ncbi:MAG: histidine triad nucleotide-binding protein [Oscillospiraceae bacterium]|nr:histidine triad nucleotide-binding protein [Oscillospiraceae bacterium]
MDNCIFCKIIKGELPSEKVYQDEEIIAFVDIKPQAPVHILVIPKKHIDGADTLPAEDAGLTGRLVIAAARIAEQFHLSGGYRIVTNIGKDGGQTVRHLHFHLLGGEKLKDSY